VNVHGVMPSSAHHRSSRRL